jgi:hypothetical protein
MISGMQMTTETTSYGEWPSPIGGADVARKQIGLSFPTLAGDTVWWQEIRPSEGGRQTVVCQGPDGISRELLPAPWNARTRVHEYGGRSYLPLADGFVFASFSDQRLYRSRDGVQPEPLTAAPGADTSDRFADFVLAPGEDEVWCVRERHGQRVGLLRLPGSVAGRHPAGLDLLGPPADAVGRHRAQGRGARRRPGER